VMAHPDYEVIEDLSELTIETPSLACQQTKKIRLSNDLEVICISDPESRTSGAALSVETGSFSDPKERPGMAHYVEHMLFLGNEKYPNEEDFSQFLDAHGGQRNAFTMSDRTVYMFSMNNDSFLEGLDRLGHFFINPAFTESGLGRECKAIHQEFCKNVPVDEWRVHYVQKELCSTAHPFHGFCIGNLATLCDVTPEEIRSWYNAHYSSNIMHLVVYSNEPMEVLEEKVNAVFSKIPNKGYLATADRTPIFCSEKKQKSCCVVVPHQPNRCALELNWELDASFCNDLEMHADRQIGYVLGHEGKNSLLARLKKEALAEGVAVGAQKIGSGQALFTISIELTPKGVANYERVITHCFCALNALKKSSIPRYIYDEICTIGKLNYAYQSRSDTFDFVREHARRMVDEPIATFPNKTIIPTSYDGPKIDAFLQTLRPENCQYLLLADPIFTGVEPSQKEQWLGVEYAFQPISDKSLASWQKASATNYVILPEPNPYLSSEIAPPTLKKQEQTEKVFSIALEERSDAGKLFVAEDTTFLTPEVSWVLHIKSPMVDQADRTKAALAELYCTAFEHEMNQTTYLANLAKLKFSIAPEKDGIVLSLSGFNNKADLLLKEIAVQLKEFSLDKERLQFYKQMMARKYERFSSSSPLNQANETMQALLYQEHQTVADKKVALQKINLKKMNSFCRSIFNEGYLEATCYGHQSSDEAKEIFARYTGLFKKPFAPKEHSCPALAHLKSIDQPTYFEQDCQIPANALLLALDFGKFSFKDRAAQEILCKGLQEPFFSELRTRQQTAYLVTNWSKEMERELYAFFAIQSSSHDARDLLARFELFFESFVDHLEQDYISEERFEKFKVAHIQQLQRPQASFEQMGVLLHTLAFEYEGDFNWLDKRIKGFEELTYEEFTQFAHSCLAKQNSRRLAVLIKGDFSNEEQHFSYELANNLENIKKRITYVQKERAQ